MSNQRLDSRLAGARSYWSGYTHTALHATVEKSSMEPAFLSGAGAEIWKQLRIRLRLHPFPHKEDKKALKKL